MGCGSASYVARRHHRVGFLPGHDAADEDRDVHPSALLDQARRGGRLLASPAIDDDGAVGELANPLAQVLGGFLLVSRSADESDRALARQQGYGPAREAASESDVGAAGQMAVGEVLG